MKARFLHEGKAIDYTPASDVAAGDVIVQGSLAGVALRDMTTGQLGALQVAGVFDIAKASGDGGITAGAKVYWNAANGVATTDADDGGEVYTSFPYLGKAVEAAGDTAVLVRVRLEQ